MVDTIPVLPSSDLDVTVRFFEALGFHPGALYPGEYLVMTGPDGIELHFFAARHPVDPARNDHGCYVRLAAASDSQELYQRWAQPATEEGGRIGAPTDTDYGLREFALLDPDGNLIRVGGRLSEAS